MSFNMDQRSLSGVANELIRINDAGDAAVLISRSASSRLIGPYNAAAALNDNVFLAPGDLGRQGDFKLHRRADLERSVGTNIDTGGAQIAGDAAGLASGIALIDLDRQ